MKKQISWKHAILGALLPVLISGNLAIAGTFQASSLQELKVIEADVRAAQFLSRATFGPTKTDIAALSADIQELGAQTAFENWIDIQLALPATLHHPLAKEMILYDGYPRNPDPSVNTYFLGKPSTTNYRHYAWWHTAISAPDQLRQRMAWALAQTL